MCPRPALCALALRTGLNGGGRHIVLEDRPALAAHESAGPDVAADVGARTMRVSVGPPTPPRGAVSPCGWGVVGGQSAGRRRRPLSRQLLGRGAAEDRGLDPHLIQEHGRSQRFHLHELHHLLRGEAHALGGGLEVEVVDAVVVEHH